MNKNILVIAGVALLVLLVVTNPLLFIVGGASGAIGYTARAVQTSNAKELGR